jgi:hypothetical protein
MSAKAPSAVVANVTHKYIFVQGEVRNPTGGCFELHTVPRFVQFVQGVGVPITHAGYAEGSGVIIITW